MKLKRYQIKKTVLPQANLKNHRKMLQTGRQTHGVAAARSAAAPCVVDEAVLGVLRAFLKIFSKMFCINSFVYAILAWWDYYEKKQKNPWEREGPYEPIPHTSKRFISVCDL